MQLRSLLILSCSAHLLAGADAEPRWRVLNHAAREAVQAKDYKKLRETLRELQPLMPGNPTIVYNLAAADAVLGDKQAALTQLRNLAGMGLVYDFAADADFSSLHESSEYRAIVKQIDENKKSVTHSSPAFYARGARSASGGHHLRSQDTPLLRQQRSPVQDHHRGR